MTLPPLDPEMRAAIARRLLFCRGYRQLKRRALREHNQRPERLARLAARHRLVQWQFASLRRGRAAVRRIEAQTGWCAWAAPWWALPRVDAVPDVPSFNEALGIEEDDRAAA